MRRFAYRVESGNGLRLLLLLEQLAISRQLLRVENSFDLLVGAVPDGAHLGRLAPRTAAAFSAACAIGRRTTPTPTAPSAAPSTTLTPRSSALTSRVFSEGLHLHCFVSEDRADSSLLRGIEL
jgi:hypothetical protein